MRITKNIAVLAAVPALALGSGLSACSGGGGGPPPAASAPSVTLTVPTPYWFDGTATLGGNLPAGTVVTVNCDGPSGGTLGGQPVNQTGPAYTDVNVLAPNVPATGAEVQLYGQVGPAAQACTS
jgi:hypothetical protein